MNQKTTKFNTSIICPVCNIPSNVITDHESRESICINCGSILANDKLQNMNEQQTFQSKGYENSKVTTYGGFPTSLSKHDRGLYTTIGKTSKDASGQIIDIQMKNRINRWRILDTRNQFKTNKERNLFTAFVYLQKLKDELGLPDSVIEKAAYIYRKIQDKGISKNIPIKVVIAVACYIACREMEIPRTLKELAEISNTDEKRISKVYRNLILELDLKVPLPDPLKMIVKIANMCKTSEKTKRCAISLMNDILNKKLFTSKDPMGLAGSIVYMACKINGENIIQYQIANAAEITTITIRKNLKFLNTCLKT